MHNFILADRHPALVEAWQNEFKNYTNFQFYAGDVFDKKAEVIVSPANSENEVTFTELLSKGKLKKEIAAGNFYFVHDYKDIHPKHKKMSRNFNYIIRIPDPGLANTANVDNTRKILFDKITGRSHFYLYAAKSQVEVTNLNLGLGEIIISRSIFTEIENYKGILLYKISARNKITY